jgi:uncharacterized membrane protein YbjE (DUF340 family)
MHLIFESLWPIALALLLGLGLGRQWPHLARWTGPLLKLLIVLLLFCCGREFSNILQLGPTLGKILQAAAVYAVLTTAASWLFILAYQRHAHGATVAGRAPCRPGQWRLAVWDGLVALGTVVLGVAAGQLDLPWLDLVDSHQLIIVMVLLIGVELVEVPLASIWTNRHAWAMPCLVIAGSAVGGAGASLWTGDSVRTGLAIASGFGWVTLSSLLVGEALGDTYGAMTMASDMLRELLAITALYLFGARFRSPSIGICGATALDATLPLIRAQCGPDAVPLALLSGLALTLASPVLIVICLRL